MSTATLSGHNVLRTRVNLPAWGIPWLEASLDVEAALTGRVSPAVADLTLVGTVMSGGAGPVGRSSFRVAAGAGGWGKKIPAKSYANDAGVKASTVLIDAASACGETIDPTTLPPPETRIGPSWAREEGPAARTLEQLAPSAWYVRESDGMTVIGKRPATVLTTPVTVLGVDRARRIVTLSAESIAAIVPGVVVEGIEAVDVQHELAPGAGLVTTIWGAGITTTSRRLTLLRGLLDQLDPSRRFRGVYEYRIVSQELERLNLEPVRVSTGMPPLQRVPVRPGIPGAKGEHAEGATVLVQFVDASPGRPIVTGFEEADGGGFAAPSLSIDADEILLGAAALLGAARQTDPVVAGPFAGTITGGSAITRIA
jgi:hypothetical protein